MKSPTERRSEIEQYRAEGRTVCTPEEPRTVAYAHQNDVLVGDCGQGCCDDWQCTDCGRKYRFEWPD